MAFTATALGGYWRGASSDGPDLGVDDDLPRVAEDQLAYEGLHVAVTASALSAYDAFRRGVPARDAAFITALSLNAGAGEEALFRGWLLPLMYPNFGRHFWLANALQAGLFGAGHIPQAQEVALAITAWGPYEGWLVRRNGWSIRESIFHHFWYDVLIGTATLLTDERAVVRLRLPAIQF